MLKVMIADDEQNICLMIQKLVIWEAYGMEVIGLVHNGLDAVRMLEEKRPDIIITDIRMPGYDGLQIVQKAKDLDLSADIIIISGYQYFEYAHKSLSLGVEHYLLKPIDQKELNETLDKIVKRRQEYQEKEAETENLIQRATYSRRKIKKHFLSSIIERRDNLTKLELNNVNDEYQCEFENGYFVVIFAKLDTENSNHDLTGLLNKMEGYIDRDLQDSDKEYINSIMKTGVISIVNYRSEIRDDTKVGMENPFVQMKRELEKFQGYHITMGIGTEKNSIAEISESLREAIAAVKCRCKVGVDKIIYYDQLKFRDVSIEQYLDENHIRKIRKVTEVLDFNVLKDEIFAIYDEIKLVPFYSPVAVYDYLEEISGIIIEELKRTQSQEIQLHHLEENIEKVLDFYTSLDEMIYRFTEEIRKEFERIILERKSRSQLPIRLAKQYVQENYFKQVSLEDVADAINLSPAYLSTMFKKGLGINFSDYLISCRVEEAKKLLKTTDLPIAGIAEKVGYTDFRHFSKTFQKVVGLKPSVYRKLYW